MAEEPTALRVPDEQRGPTSPLTRSSDRIPLGDRMKHQYEDRYRILLPRRTYTIIRVDGKTFHSVTRKCNRPYDDGIIHAMNCVALALCVELQGVRFAYTQSDEVSVLLTDFETETTDAAFDGNLQKIVSVSASIATAAFNGYVWQDDPDHANALSKRVGPLAMFDSRAFVIPDPVEVENYFIWRQQDAERNSLLMLAQAHYSHKELRGVKKDQQHDLIHAKGDNWDSHPDRFKRGGVVIRRENGWVTIAPPVFTQDRNFLSSRIPKYGTEELT